MRNRRDRFVALAEARTNKALHDLRLIGNLANRNNYEYDAGDVKKIMRALETELTVLKDRFNQAERLAPAPFTLQ